ncbi:MAG: glucosaminidase domain-containing protein, partial [Pseudomonadota bacterium]
APDEAKANIASQDDSPSLHLATSLPAHLADPDLAIPVRKQQFLETLAPLIAVANQEIIEQRARIISYQQKLQEIGSTDISALDDLFAAYGVRNRNIKHLLIRADIMPIPVILAQAAIETGWGRSRYSHEGQALFGIWTSSKELGMVMADRAQDFPWRIRKYDSLLESVRGYYRNINTHASYRKMRSTRYQLRQQYGNDLHLHAEKLWSHLDDYAEDSRYTRLITKVIAQNKLDRFATLDHFATQPLLASQNI